MTGFSIGGRRQHDVAAAAVWILLAVFAGVALGDVVVILALAAGAVTIAFTAYRRVRTRAAGHHAEVASVTQLRPAVATRRDPRNAPGGAPWHGPRAA
jgi:hypothetical protein